jgi:hypothetical protein
VEQIHTAQPRLDILVTRDGQNLFTVEVKGPDIAIDSDDIDQAVSYARLVHPIAPLCLITNGQVWKLVDTITKEELDPKEVGPHLPLNVTLPDEDYYQALKYFLGYSRENILAFCQWQVQSYMEPLRGSADNRDKKYIPELYEERRDLTATTQRFMQEEARCFGVVGDSGSGKTCWACHEAIRSLEQGVVTFFYRGKNVERGILEAISHDLNWTLSTHYDDIQAVKRLLELFRHEQLVVWIDEIDGLPPVLARRVLEDFLRRTEGHRVKLLLTCKSETWQYLLKEDGIPTMLASRIFQVNDEKGYQVGPLEEQEMLAAIMKYRAFYHYTGKLDIEVLEMCQRVPFLLRVLFEVAVSLSLPHIGYSVVEVFDAYFQQLCSRFDEQKDMIQRLLPKIARQFYEQNSDEIELDDLLDALGVSPLQPLPEQLFSLSILERTYHEQTIYIGFYFKKLRDYLIAFRALKWHKKSTQDFRQLCIQLDRHGVHLDILNLYYSLTSSEAHKRVLDDQLYANASAFLSLYEDILNTYFPAFKQSFPPNTSGPIGFVGYVDFSHNAISMYGFRPLKNAEAKILLMPTAPIPGAWMKENKGYIAGSLRMHRTDSSRGFQNIDIVDEIFSYNVRPSLKEILQQGKLDESQNKELLIEHVLATCVTYCQDYFEKCRQIASHSYLPFRLGDLREYVLYKIAHAVLTLQYTDREIASGRSQEKRISFIHTTSVAFSVQVQAEIEEQAWMTAKQGKNMAYEREQLQINDGAFLSLLEDIDNLEKLHIVEITSTPLTAWYDKYRGGIPRLQGSELFAEINQLLESLYLSFLNEYQMLVARNFPTLCHNFKFYSYLPAKFSIALETAQYDPSPQINPLAVLGIVVQKHRENTEVTNAVVLSTSEEIYAEGDRRRVDPAFKGPLHSSSIASSILSPHRSFTTFKVKTDLCILRNMVYQQIEEDIGDVLNALVAKRRG